MLDLPPVIGHRGAASAAPENTMAGLRAAADASVRWVEFDVRFTADRQCVLLHDADLLRTCGLRASVAQSRYRDIADLSAGAWFGPGFAPERVPLLADALALAVSRGLGVDIELKPEPGTDAARRRAFCAAVSRTITASGLDRARNCLVSSFDAGLLRDMREAGETAPLAIAFNALTPGWLKTAQALGCAAVVLNAGCYGRAAPDTGGLPALVYTVNSTRRARALWRKGVTAVISDNPAALLAAAPGAAI